MSNKEHVSILLEGIEKWNEYRKLHHLQKPDFIDADLRGANISGANLRSAILIDTNFMGVDFTQVELSGVDLSKALFVETIK